MNEFEKKEIQSNLARNLQKYIGSIIEKYGKYIPQEKLDTLNNISDFENLIKIYDYGSVNAYANDHEIRMPLCADKLLNTASKIPGYGINKEHKSYNSENLISNNNTYINYIYRVFYQEPTQKVIMMIYFCMRLCIFVVAEDLPH